MRIARATTALAKGETLAYGNATLIASAKAKAGAIAMAVWTGAVKAATVAGRILRIVTWSMLGPWGLLVAAIVLGAVLIYKNWDKIKGWAKQLWNVIKQVWRAISNAVVNYVQDMANRAGKRWQQFTTGIKILIEGARKIVTGAVEAIRSATIGNLTTAAKGGVDRFQALRKGISSNIEAARKWVVEKVEGMKKGALERWDMMRKGAAERFDAIRKGISDRIETTRKNVVAALEAMRKGAANVWDNMKKAASSFGDGFKRIVVDAIQGAVNLMRKWLGGAALGLANLLGKLGVGPEEELRDVGESLQQPLTFARGGIAMGDKPYFAGEQGEKEAIVNLQRRTPESKRAAAAVMRSPNAPTAGGGLPDGGYAPHARADRRARRRGGAGAMDAYGPTLPVSELIPEMQAIAKKVKAKFPVSANTYTNHPPGFKQPFYRQRSVDFWGSGGRGDAIGGFWPEVASYARSLAGSAANWVLNPGNDAAHAGANAHVHLTAFAGTGAGKGTSGGIDVLGMFSDFASALAPFPSGGIMDLFSGLGGKVLGWMKDFVIEQAKNIMGGLFGGSSPSGLTLGEAVLKGGWPTSLAQKAVGVAWEESGANASAQNPSGARGLFQIMPQTAKGIGANYGKLKDPIYNSSAGYKVYKSQGWGAWVAYPPSQSSMSRGSAPVTGYARGGIVPGARGTSRLIEAHAGERVLPERIVRAFDNMAVSIERLDERQRFDRHTALAHRTGDRAWSERRLEGIENKLERQLDKMHDIDDLVDALVSGAAALQFSDFAEGILDKRMSAKVNRARQLLGKVG
jgi:hypothetical protein